MGKQREVVGLVVRDKLDRGVIVAVERRVRQPGQKKRGFSDDGADQHFDGVGARRICADSGPIGVETVHI